MNATILRSLILAALVLSFTSHANGQGASAENVSQQSPATGQIKVFKVINRNVNEIGNSLRLLMESEKFRIAVDLSTNSLIVSATGTDAIEKMDVLGELLNQLDVQPNVPKSKQVLRTYPMDNLPASSMMVLQTIFAGRNIRMQSTPGSNSLVVMADPTDHELMLTTLESLKPEPQSAPQQLQFLVSATFIVSGKSLQPDIVKDAGKLTNRIEILLAKAEAKGIFELEQPIIVAKTLNRVTTRSNGNAGRSFEFRNSSTSSNQTFELKVSGRGQAMANNLINMDSNLEVLVGSMGSSNNQPARSAIDSNIHAKFGVPIILSFSKINGLDTIIIMEVFDVEEDSK